MFIGQSSVCMCFKILRFEVSTCLCHIITVSLVVVHASFIIYTSIYYIGDNPFYWILFFLDTIQQNKKNEDTNMT